jgi:hypothetical protein
MQRLTRALLLAACLIVAGCAAPEVDRSRPGFDARSYSEALSLCRGVTGLAAGMESLQAAAVGSLLGAYYGAIQGNMAGDSEEGAIIGTILGGTIGLGVGASRALAEREQKITNCLREKGYSVLPV